jgi:hypothetical protein
LAGLLGGAALDRLLHKQSWLLTVWGVQPYQLLFGISWLGRLTAALWLIPIRVSPRTPEEAGREAGAASVSPLLLE